MSVDQKQLKTKVLEAISQHAFYIKVSRFLPYHLRNKVEIQHNL